MPSILPAPFLPDLGDVLRKASEEGFKQGLAWVVMDDGKQCRIRCSFFIHGSDTNCRDSIGEAPAETKRKRGQSPEGLFVAQDDNCKKSTGAARTILSSGPYAGLQSAKKRVRETVDPEEKAVRRFGPAKKVCKKSGTPQNV